MKTYLLILTLAPLFASAEKTVSQKIDAELTRGAKKIGTFFEEKKAAKAKNKKKKKSPTKSTVDSVNEAGDSVLGGIGEILDTQKK